MVIEAFFLKPMQLYFTILTFLNAEIDHQIFFRSAMTSMALLVTVLSELTRGDISLKIQVK